MKNVRGNITEALPNRDYTLDEEQCKRLIVQVSENYVLADRENAFLLSCIKYSAAVIVMFSASYVIGWLFNSILTKKSSKNAQQPGSNIIESADYSGCIPKLLQKLNECKIEGIKNHKYLTEMRIAHQNNDFETYGIRKCVKSDEFDLLNTSGDDDVFELTQSTDSQSQCSGDENTPDITSSVDKKRITRRSSNVRVTKI